MNETTIPWEGVIALLDTPTDDGRPGIPSKGFNTRALPIPLRSVLSDAQPSQWEPSLK